MSVALPLVQKGCKSCACIEPKHCTRQIMRYFSDLGITLSGRGVNNLNMRVFQSNGYSRQFVVPANPETAEQVSQRAIFSQLSSDWNAITDVQRQEWEAAAVSGDFKITDPKTGSQRNPKSGLELYKSLNGYIATMNGNTSGSIDTPPAPGIPGDTLVTGVVADASAGTVAITYSGALGANEGHVVRMAQATSAGRMKPRPTLQRIILTNDTSASPIAAGAFYTGKFGAITAKAGMKIFYRVEAYDTVTGQTRLVGSGSTIIVA